jgi:hypothetical protein
LNQITRSGGHRIIMRRTALGVNTGDMRGKARSPTVGLDFVSRRGMIAGLDPVAGRPLDFARSNGFLGNAVAFFAFGPGLHI